MAKILNFDVEWEDPETLDAAGVRAALERVEALIARMDEAEPEDMESAAYESWADRHETLEDLADELRDRLDELGA